MNQFIELLNHNLADNLTVSHDSPKSEKTDLRPILMSILINKTWPFELNWAFRLGNKI